MFLATSLWTDLEKWNISYGHIDLEFKWNVNHGPAWNAESMFPTEIFVPEHAP